MKRIFMVTLILLSVIRKEMTIKIAVIAILLAVIKQKWLQIRFVDNDNK